MNGVCKDSLELQLEIYALFSANICFSHLLCSSWMKYVMQTLGFYQLIIFVSLMVRYMEYNVFLRMREIHSWWHGWHYKWNFLMYGGNFCDAQISECATWKCTVFLVYIGLLVHDVRTDWDGYELQRWSWLANTIIWLTLEMSFKLPVLSCFGHFHLN